MSNSTNLIIKHKAGLLNLAQELGNVSKACKVMGVSRDTLFKTKEIDSSGTAIRVKNSCKVKSPEDIIILQETKI